MRIPLLAFLIIGGCSPSAPHAAAQPKPPPSVTPAQIDFSKAIPVDENYRNQFSECDQRNVFAGMPMEGFRKCSGDPNHLTRLVRFKSVPGLPGDAIAFTSKLGVDYDGSWVAAHTPGLTDLKDTSKEFPGPDGKNGPTDSDTVAYVVIPNAGNADANIRNGFSIKTGVHLGNVGVVIFRDIVVPVIVADGGPFNKIGEGSMALHRALGTELCLTRNSEGNCTKVNLHPSSIEGGATTIIFVDSGTPGATAATVEKATEQEATKLFDVFRNSYAGSP
jgi:hypothetical protein